MSSNEPSETRLARRRQRLITELADEGVDLQVAADDPLFGAIIEEIAYARQPLVHEGRRGSYGALVSGTPGPFGPSAEDADRFPMGARIPLRDGDPGIDHIRRTCNGRTTFLVRSTRGPECLLELNAQASRARIQPGLVLDTLRTAAEPLFGFTVFAPPER